MRRYITILVAVVALHGGAMAQTQNRVGAEVFINELEYQDNLVNVNLTFDLDELKIGANESVVFTPKIYKGEMTKELPTFVVRRRGGAKSFERASVLENSKSLAAYEEWYGEPHQIVEFYGSDKSKSADYAISIPYESWMVGSKLYVDSSTCGCCNEDDSGALVPADNQLLIDIPTVTPYEISPLVELQKPEKVAVKRRDIAYSSALIFKVNSTYIDPNLDRNSAELASIDEMMQSVISDDDYTITKVNIIGFASPEGKLESNMRLSEGRAKALEQLMMRKYKNIAPELYSVRFGGENWEKLYEMVSESDIEDRDAVLSIIDNYTIEEGRESKLMALKGGAPYRYLLRTIFPATRLVVVDVEYNVDAYDLVRIGELIDTKPQNLSLEEMYRLSETFNVSDEEFEKIFMTAITVYPDDEVAQNNALVTEIRNGNLDSVADVAARVDADTDSAELANSLGAYYMLSGDYQSAESMLQRSIDLGSERAEENMRQLRAKMENLEQIKASEEFRKKIYGEN